MKPSLSLGERTPLAEGELELPRSPGVIRRFWARHPWLADSLVAGTYLFFGLAMAVALAFVPALDEPARPQSGILVGLRVLATVLMAGAILFRRYRPWTVLVVTWIGTLAGLPLEGAIDVLPIPIALYALAVYRSARDAWYGFAASVVVGTAAAQMAAAVSLGDVIPFGAAAAASSSQLVTGILIATLIGVNVGNRKRYVAALVDRAKQLAKERDQQAQLATATERSRIAREMHDIVSHSLTVIVALAEGSSAVVATSPNRASAAMRQVAGTGRHALTDMRRMLGLLDGDGKAASTADTLEPQPGVADLSNLVETFRSASLPVRFTSRGSPPRDQGVQLTVYRIVQESLTNALRYATGASEVEVEIVYEAGTVTVTVTDDGNGPTLAATDAPGHGLLGMGERVSLYGGTLESGPSSRGGWSVRAVLNEQAEVERE
jgi:signal transduction histidine kinase